MKVTDKGIRQNIEYVVSDHCRDGHSMRFATSASGTELVCVDEDYNPFKMRSSLKPKCIEHSRVQ
jgi:hypothetical protein